MKIRLKSREKVYQRKLLELLYSLAYAIASVANDIRNKITFFEFHLQKLIHEIHLHIDKLPMTGKTNNMWKSLKEILDYAFEVENRRMLNHGGSKVKAKISHSVSKDKNTPSMKLADWVAMIGYYSELYRLKKFMKKEERLAEACHNFIKHHKNL